MCRSPAERARSSPHAVTAGDGEPRGSLNCREAHFPKRKDPVHSFPPTSTPSPAETAEPVPRPERPWRAGLQPRGAGRMVPERVWAGARPAGRAGQAGGRRLTNATPRAVWRKERLRKVRSLECHSIPSHRLAPGRSSGFAPPSQAFLPLAAASRPRVLHIMSPCLFVCVCFFFDGSSDVQEKIIKADRPGREAFISSCWAPAESGDPE